MIMRIFQVSIHPGKEEEFSKFFHDTAVPLMKNTEGIVSVFPGNARPESPKAFVGEDYESPHIDPAEAKLVASRTIKHYDLVET